MKCTNCGFEAENNAVCPICGTQLRSEPIVIPTYSYDEATEAARKNNNPGAQSQNPYMQNPAPQNPNPYAQNTAPQNPNPYAQNSAPQSPNPYTQSSIPQYPNPYSQAGAPQYTNVYAQDNTRQSAPPKPRKKAAPMVVAIVMSCIAAAGIILAVTSSIVYRTGFIENIMKSAERSYESAPEYDYDDGYYDEADQLMDKESDYYYNFGDYSVGIPFEYAYGTVCLNEVTLTEGTSLSEGLCRLHCEVEVKNTSDEDITLVPNYPDVYSDTDAEARFITESVTTDDESGEIVLKPGESSVYTCELLGSSDSNSLIIDIPLTLKTENSTYSMRDIDLSYNINVRSLESAAAEKATESATEPATKAE